CALLTFRMLSFAGHEPALAAAHWMRRPWPTIEPLLFGLPLGNPLEGRPRNLGVVKIRSRPEEGNALGNALRNALRHPGRLRRGDAVDLDVEATWPRRDIDEDPRRWVFGKIPGIDRVHGSKFIDRCAVNVALENLLKRRSCRLKTELHLLKHNLR